MSVNQMAFLGLFFLSVAVYYCMPKKCQWMALLGISLFFYHLMGADNFLYILISAGTLTYGTGRMYERDRLLQKELEEKGTRLSRAEKKEKKEHNKSIKFKWLLGIIIINLGILLVLKYGDFFISNINGILGVFGISGMNRLGFVAPLGMSYYTLQVIGYALEVYKGKFVPEKNPLKVLLFVTYYPQMTQGPIGRAELGPQLWAGHSFCAAKLSRGCQRILWGLFKKAVVADNLRPLVQNIFSNYDSVSGFTLVMGCVYMVFQMYADFSGYTDIVSGMSEIYGIRMTENFKQPLFSQSLGEYWRRWHISLSSWFRDYVFYPASVSKTAVKFGKWGQRHFSPRIKKVFPVLFAMSLVWFCTGFWHDASWRYIIWGVGNGAVLIGGIVLEPQFEWMKKKLHIKEDVWWWKGFSIFRTFMIVSLLKVFPGAGGTMESFYMTERILLHFDFRLSYDAFFPGAKWYTLSYAMLGLLLMLIVSLLQTRTGVRDWLGKRPPAVRWAVWLFLIGALICMGSFESVVVGGFEYAQF